MIQKVELKSNFRVVRLYDIDGDELQPYIDDINIYYDNLMYNDIFWTTHLVKPEHNLSFILDNIELFYLGHAGEDYDCQIKNIKDQELKENIIKEIKKALLKESI